jgi:5'-nucleotidase
MIMPIKKIITKKIYTAIVLLAALLVTDPSNACSQAVPDQKPGRLTIIGTGDLQGRLDPADRTISLTETGEKTAVSGGISRIATLIKQIRSEADHPVLVLSSGDDLMGAYFHLFAGKAIFKLMDMAGYQLLTLGNHEFDSGPGVLAEALDSVQFTALCSDLNVSNTVMAKSCQPWLIRDYQGIRVGFFSLMTEDFPVVTVTGKVTVQSDHTAAARSLVQSLKDQGADLIIAVTHIGTDLDRKLAAEVAGIDIIFGGHSHAYLEEMETVNNTLIVNGGEKGAALMRLDIDLTGNRQKEIELAPDSAVYRLLPVTSDIAEDAAVEEQLAKYRQQLPAATVVGTTDQEWDLTKKSLRSRESAVANMITDLIRRQFAVDIVLYNGGAFRGNAKYPPGPVTDTMLAEIDEFENNVYLMTMQGKYIRQILEHSATLSGSGGFLQVSGIRFTIDTGRQAQQLSHQGATDYQISRLGKRISSITVQTADGSWQPLNMEKSYRLASNDFLVKLGGDHYFWFKQYGQDIRNTYSTMATLLTDALRKQKTVNPVGPDSRIILK